MKKIFSPKRFSGRLRIAWKRYYAMLIFLPLLAVVIWATQIEPNLVHVVHYEVPLPAGAAPELNDFTIAFLSDLHLNERVAKILPEVIARTNALHADVILLGGDFFVNDCAAGTDDYFPRYFSQLQATCGSYAIVGNHDALIVPDTRRLTASGHITLLENQSVRLRGVGGGEINLVGIEQYNGHEITNPGTFRTKLRNDMPNIVLTHEPDFLRYVPGDVFLVLAGHTHGGQLNLPFFGPLLRSARTPAEQLYGLSRRGQTTLIVTGGIGNGNGFPLRFCTMPEIVCIKLKAPRPSR